MKLTRRSGGEEIGDHRGVGEESKEQRETNSRKIQRTNLLWLADVDEAEDVAGDLNYARIGAPATDFRGRCGLGLFSLES